MKEKRDLKEYIVKLNDRNIQRQRETGFTLYAILGAIIFCVFFFIDNINVAYNIYSNSKFLNVTVFTANTVLVLFFYYNSYSITTKRKRLTKIFPYQQPLAIDANDFPFFIFCTIISLLSFFYFSRAQDNIHRFYLLFFGFITAMNIISPLLISIIGKQIRRNKRKKGLTIETIDFTFFNEKAIRILSILYLCYAIVMSIFSFVVWTKLDFGLMPEQVSIIIKYVIIFFAFLYLIKIAMDIKSKENDNNQLEDFEKEIFFENISNEEIAKKFETDFSGIPFSKWLNDKMIEITDFFAIKQQEFLTQDLLLMEVDKIDSKTMRFEYDGRLKLVINGQLESLKTTNDFVQRITSTFSNLKNFASINDDELNQLNSVQTFLNQNIQSFNNQYSNLSRQIANRTSSRG